MTSKQRLKPAVRRVQILEAALVLAEKGHYLRLTRNEIAARAGLAGTTVQYHFKTMIQLRRAIMRAAVAWKNLPVLAQGITAGDSQALKASQALQDQAMGR